MLLFSEVAKLRYKLYVLLMQIRVFSTSTCPKCSQLKDYLKARGLEFENVNLSEQPARMAELQTLAPGTRSVPVLVLGEGAEMRVIHGFDEMQLSAILK